MKIAFTYNLQTARSEDQAEFDTPDTVRTIEEGLGRLGHEVSLVEVSGPVSAVVRRIERLRPDLVFNTAEGLCGRAREAFYPALFEQLGVAYTGADAYTCAVTLDKHLTKCALSRHRIPMAPWLFFERLEDIDAHEISFPVIIKPNFEGSSVGITGDSVAETRPALRARAAALLERFPAGLIVEEYIGGRDLVVPFLEAASPATGGILEPATYAYRGRGSHARQRFSIYDFDMKMHGFDDLVVQVPAEIGHGVRAEVMRLSRTIIERLGVRDLGRIDYRLDERDQVYFLEVNALPSLEAGASIFLSGALVGLDSTEAVLDAIIQSALRRSGRAPSSRWQPRAQEAARAPAS